MREIASCAHVLVTCVVIALAVRALRAGRGSILAFTVLGFAVFGSLGLAIAPYLPLERIRYLNSPLFVIRTTDLHVYLSQLASHWTFFLVACVGLLSEATWRRERILQVRFRHWKLKLWVGGLMLVGSLAFLRYFVLGPGWEILTSTRIAFESTSLAVASRQQGRVLTGLGQGDFMAAIAATIVFPVAALLSTRATLRGWRAILAACVLLSGAYALQTRQKAPLLVVAMAYGLLLIWIAVTRKGTALHTSWRRLRGAIIALGVLLFLVGAVFYCVNFGVTPSAAAEGMLARTLVIPAATETNYFFVFPDVFPFRGLSRALMIPLGRNPVANDTTIYDVAVASTGDRFSSNASFLAVAWSGAGMIGVMLVSIVVVAGLCLVDRVLRLLDEPSRLAILAVSAQSLLGLTSGGFLDYLRWGGIILPLVATLSLLFSARFSIGSDPFASNMEA